MGGNFDEFDRRLDEYVKTELPERVLEFQQKVAGDAIDKVVTRTPVLDGTLRFNWQATVGGGVGLVAERPGADNSSKGSATREEMKGFLRANLKPYDSAFLANPMPYAEVIEEGKCPSPVKRGTRIRNARRRQRRRGLLNRSADARTAFLLAGETADYEIRSAGGFSKQSPAGMVGVTVLDLMNYFERD